MNTGENNKGLVSWAVDADGVAVIHMHDTEGKNALSEDFVEALSETITAAVGDPSTKVLVVTGMEDVFCSGAPKELLMQLVDNELVPGDIQLPGFLLNVPLPMIAAMEGHAIGGGLALGVCADIVIASRESRYGCSFMNFGLSPGMGTTRLLEHVMSPARAAELMFTGEFKRGSEFEANGDFNYVLSRGEVRPKALDLAARISEKPRVSLETLKKGLAETRLKIFEQAFASEQAMHIITLDQPDIRKFIEDEYVE